MNLDHAKTLARSGQLYPSVVLHGGQQEERVVAAEYLARTLLCEASRELRPCERCRHCRRISLLGERGFHPDVLLVDRDLRTSTSIDAVKTMLRTAQVYPFEARGQVFVITEAESLQAGAANALLKTLEEPGLGAPRHFLLLAATAGELLPTLRSRSLLVFLAGEERAMASEIEGVVADLAGLLMQPPTILLPMRLAARLLELGDFRDPRSSTSWNVAARCLLDLGRRTEPTEWRSALLDSAFDLLESQEMRLRSISPQRIFEGVFSRNLAGLRTR